MLIGACTVLLSGLAHLHNCWTPRAVGLPPLLQFYSLPITSPLTQAYYPEYLLMCVTALQPCETEKIHCILIGAVVSVRTWGWICNSSENSIPGLYQLTESRLLDFVCLLCSFWLMSSRFSLMPATLSFGWALWCEVSVWSQGTPSTNVAQGEEWSHWKAIL